MKLKVKNQKKLNYLKMYLTELCALGKLKLIKKLSSKLIPPDYRNPSHDDIRNLMYAAGKNNRVQVLEHLLSLSDRDSSSAIYGACEGGHLNLVKLLFYYSDNRLLYDRVVSNACKSNNEKLIIYVLEYMVNGALYDDGAVEACKNNNLRMLKKVFEHSPDLTSSAEMLDEACKHKNIKMIEFLQSRSTRKGGGVIGAIQTGDIKLVEMVYSNDYTSEFFLYEACKIGNTDIIKFFIKKGYKLWDYGLEGACEGGHIKIAEDMISRGASYFSEAFKLAYEAGKQNSMELLFKKGFKLTEEEYEFIGEVDNLEIIKYLEKNKKFDYNNVFINACSSGHLNLVEYLIDKPKISYLKGFAAACETGKMEIITYFLKRYKNKKIENIRTKYVIPNLLIKNQLNNGGDEELLLELGIDPSVIKYS